MIELHCDVFEDVIGRDEINQVLQVEKPISPSNEKRPN
jgi:hypothetical protein